MESTKVRKLLADHSTGTIELVVAGLYDVFDRVNKLNDGNLPAGYVEGFNDAIVSVETILENHIKRNKYNDNTETI